MNVLVSTPGASIVRPLKAYALDRSMRLLDGSRQRLNEVVVILAGLLEGSEQSETSLLIGPARTRIGCRSSHAHGRPPCGAELVEQQRERLWADSATNRVWLANEYVHVNQVGRQIAEPGCRELLGKRALPTEVADRASVDGDQSMVRGTMLADGSHCLVPVAPPAGHMWALEPDPKPREVARYVHGDQLYG